MPQLEQAPQQITASGNGSFDTAAMAGDSAIITSSGPLSQAAGAGYTLEVLSAQIRPGMVVLAYIQNGTNTQGIPMMMATDLHVGAAFIFMENNPNAGAAFNGTLVIRVILFT
jgi:hypothetical protein